MAGKIVFDENFGDMTFAQRAAYRKFNVSPSDHTDLVNRFGEDEHDKITAFVKTNSTSGTYRAPWH